MIPLVDATEKKLIQLRDQLRRATPVDAKPKRKARWKEAKERQGEWRYRPTGAHIQKIELGYALTYCDGVTRFFDSLIEASAEGEKPIDQVKRERAKTPAEKPKKKV